MSEQHHNRKGFLKDKLVDYQVNPPEKVWDSIAAQLGGRRRRSLIIISLATAASIALVVTLGITFLGPDLPDETGIAEMQKDRSQPSQPAEEQALASQEEAEVTEAPEEQIAESRPERRRETLEERVVKTLQEVAEETIIEPGAVTGEEELAQLDQVELDQVEPDEVEPDEVEPDQFVADQADREVTEPDQEAVDQAEDGIAEGEGDVTGEGDISGGEQVPEPDPDIIQDPDLDTPPDPIPEIEEDQQRDPRWIIGAALSPLYSFRDAEASAMAGAAEYESGVMAYAGGIHVSYSTGSRLAIESGIFYNKMGISIGAPGIQLFNESFDFSPLGGQESNQSQVTTVTNSVGNIIARSGEVFVNNYKLNAAYATNAFTDNTLTTFSTAEDGIRQHLDYLELPFNLRYTLIDRAIELQLVGGMSTNILVNNYVTMETASGTTEIGYLTNIRNVNYSGNAGVGMIYHIQEQFSLRLEPRFRYFLNSINDATLPSTRPYTLGIYTGLSYTF